MASRPTSPMPPPARSTPASTWRWRSSTPPTPTCPRRWSQVRRARRRSTPASGGCSRRRSGWACFDSPYVDEDRAREVLADPAHRDVARIAAERSAVLLRNEGDLLPLDAGSLRFDRGDRAAGRLQARHHRALGLRLRPGRDGDRAGRHPRQGRDSGAGRSRPRGRPSCNATVPLDVRHVRRNTAPRIPRGSTRRPSSSAPSTSPREPMSRSSSRVSGRT